MEFALCTVERGGTIVLPDPGYPDYFSAVALAGARSVPFSGWDVEADALYLNYPANPTALSAPEGVFAEAVEWAERRGAWILHDFAYGDLVFDGRAPASFLAAEGAREVGIELFSMSKSYGMAGWRLGFALGSAELVRRIETLQDHAFAGIFRPVQEAGIAALTGPQESVEERRAAYERRRDRALAALGGLEAQSEGTFFVWFRLPEGVSAERLLLEHRVAVAPGEGFGAARRRLGAPVARRRRRDARPRPRPPAGRAGRLNAVPMRKALFFVSLAALALAAAAVGRPPAGPEPAPTVAIAVGGRTVRLPEGTTLRWAIAQLGLRPEAGNLVDVEGAILRPGVAAGKILLNGDRAAPRTRLRAGDRIRVVDGRDRREPLAGEVIKVRGGLTTNPQFTLARTPGSHVVVRGAMSHKLVSVSFRPRGPASSTTPSRSPSTTAPRATRRRSSRCCDGCTCRPRSSRSASRPASIPTSSGRSWSRG